MSGGLSIIKDTLGQRRLSLSIWGASIGAVSAMYASMYPLMDSFDMEAMLAAFPPAMIELLGYDEMGSAGGYIQSAVYGLVALVLLLIYGIGAGASMIAGEEQAGRLELEYTSPIPRGAIYGQRLAVLWISTSLLVSVIWIVVGVVIAILSLDVSFGNLAAATLQLWLIVGMYATAAFAIGAATGRRGWALGATAGLAVSGYMANGIGVTVGQEWLAKVSPFGWYMETNALTEGLNLVGVALLAGVTVVCAALGWLRFRQRDLGT
jgi:ABC-2 type transport system permease protein